MTVQEGLAQRHAVTAGALARWIGRPKAEVEAELRRMVEGGTAQVVGTVSPGFPYAGQQVFDPVVRRLR